MFNPDLRPFWLIPLILAAAPLAPAQGAAQALVTNDDRIAYTLSLGQEGAGKVEVRLRGPGTLVGTLEADSQPLAAPADRNLELNFVPDAQGVFRRNLKLADADRGWCWFRVVKASPSKSLVIQRTGPGSEGVVYAFDPVPTTPVLSLRRSRPGDRSTGFRLALQNQSQTAMYFHLTSPDTPQGRLPGGLLLLPPNQNAINNIDGRLAPGATRQVSFPVTPNVEFYVLVSDSETWNNVRSMEHIERFRVSAGADRPLGLEASPFRTQDKNFTQIRFAVEDSDPEYPILKIESK